MIRPPSPAVIRITKAEARRAYVLSGEPVPRNLREDWSWPQAAAFILSLAVAGWLCIGATTDVLVRTFQ